MKEYEEIGKAEFCDVMKRKYNIPTSEAKEIVERFTDTMKEVISEKKGVRLIGFGKFSIHYVKPRKGHSPANGKVIRIKAHERVTFKPSMALKQLLVKK